MSTIDEVRERLDIVDVVGDYVQLKRAGRTYKGLCPFHDERTPSFAVFPDSGNWRCFGACATGGNAFDFVMKIENLDFRGALELLARRVGVEIAPPSPAETQRASLRERLHAAAAAAAAFYHTQLLRSAAADPARVYLRARGFGIDVAQAFQLGWAPVGGAALVEALRRQGFSDAELLAGGLARQRDGGGGGREGGGLYDTFRERLMIPIHDARGQAIGFGGRTLDPAGIPKYINSSQSEIFDKSHVLFGLHRAARAIRAADMAVVVEGYTDVIRAHAGGFENVVASLGTALTEHQVRLLKRYAGTIVLALDADAAGQAATLRGLEVAREAAEGEVRPVPNMRGGVHYAPRSDVELRVATLPAGQDPDDVVRSDPAAWQRFIADARPVMDYLFAALTADLDLSDPIGKTKAADRLLPVIGAIQDPVARRAWAGKLAGQLAIDEKAFADRLPPIPGGRGAARTGEQGSGRRGGQRTDSGGRQNRGSGKPAASGTARSPVRSGAPNPLAALTGLAVDSAHAVSTAPEPETTHLEEPPDWAVSGEPVDLAPAETIPEPLPEGLTMNREVVQVAPAGGDQPEAGRPALPTADAPSPQASLILGCLIVKPKRLRALDTAFRKEGLVLLGPSDFAHAMDQDLIEAIRFASRGAAPPDAPAEHRLDALPEALARYAASLRDRVLVGPALSEHDLAGELKRGAWIIRKRAIDRSLPGLRSRLNRAQGADLSETLTEYNRLTSELQTLSELIAPRAAGEGGKIDSGVRKG